MHDFKENEKPYEHSNFLVTGPKEGEICDLPHKGFKIAVSRMLSELWETQKDYSIESGKLHDQDETFTERKKA